jgi:hypothetical protein
MSTYHNQLSVLLGYCLFSILLFLGHIGKLLDQDLDVKASSQSFTIY